MMTAMLSVRKMNWETWNRPIPVSVWEDLIAPKSTDLVVRESMDPLYMSESSLESLSGTASESLSVFSSESSLESLHQNPILFQFHHFILPYVSSAISNSSDERDSWTRGLGSLISDCRAFEAFFTSLDDECLIIEQDLCWIAFAYLKLGSLFNILLNDSECLLLNAFFCMSLNVNSECLLLHVFFCMTLNAPSTLEKTLIYRQRWCFSAVEASLVTRKEPLCSPGCGLSSPGGLGDKSADISPALSPTPSAGKSDLLAVVLLVLFSACRRCSLLLFAVAVGLAPINRLRVITFINLDGWLSGNHLCLDAMTRKERISYARVLIEVDLANELVSEILGHAFEGCSKNLRVKGQTKEKEQEKQPVHTYKQAGTSMNQEELLKDRDKDVRGDSKAGTSKNQEEGDSEASGDKLVPEDGLDMGL
ncbi:hypothetical protein M9H77_30833 [Catharanthus roseus]|uniref:Uncharacterized protein n=1 Tax=Catharanthus roseus TaxID=4058 RepID=A0ACB9ZZB3_CATRO|nr:hypothetical protein M9H77_30833 [Catharanthus roseus]